MAEYGSNFDYGLSPYYKDDGGVIVADFEADKTQGVKNLEVQFTDLSIGENINVWYWNFGDGRTSSEQNPLHFYNRPGRYTVSLTVSNGTDYDIETKINYITVDGICSPDIAPKPDINLYVRGYGIVNKIDTGINITTRLIDSFVELGFSRGNGPTLIFD